MWIPAQNNYYRIREFFRLTLSHDTLQNYYKTNFSLMHHHKYSLSDVENLLPWERDLYVNLLINHLEEEREKQLQG